MGRPIASNASVCPPAKHVGIVTEMQAVLGRRILFMVNYGLFLGVGQSGTCPGHLHPPEKNAGDRLR